MSWMKKTPMQELIEKINNEEFDHLDDCKMFIQEYMLEQEYWVLHSFALDVRTAYYDPKEYYNKIGKTEPQEEEEKRGKKKEEERGGKRGRLGT